MDRALTRGSAGYPAVFEDLEEPPEQIFVRGPLVLERPRVSVVGTRRPSERGRRLATELGRGLARAGVTVVSGGALGIDGAAHRGALEGGGPTWVVLPVPLARPVPSSHRGLFARVLEGGGAWLSEYEEEVGKHAFFQRNRLVAALGHVLVAVEAKVESGTAHSVTAARALGRPVGAYPWAVGDAYGAGCLAWLRSGAALVTGPEDVLSMLEAAGAPPARPRVADAARDPLIVALGAGGARADEVAARLERPVSAVLAALTRLEMVGAVTALPGGRFVAAESADPGVAARGR